MSKEKLTCALELLENIRDHVAYLEQEARNEIDRLESAIDDGSVEEIESALEDTTQGCMTALGGKFDLIASNTREVDDLLQQFVTENA